MSQFIVALACVAFILNVHFVTCSQDDTYQNNQKEEDKLVYDPNDKVDVTDPRFRTYDQRWVKLLKKYQDGIIGITRRGGSGDGNVDNTVDSYAVRGNSHAQSDPYQGSNQRMLLPPGI